MIIALLGGAIVANSGDTECDCHCNCPDGSPEYGLGNTQGHAVGNFVRNS